MLRSRYRAVFAATIVAKAQYFVLEEEPSASAAAVERAAAYWRELDARKHTLAAQIEQLEALAERSTT